MKMTELLRFDVPAEVIALWRERESEVLLPLQELAVKRHGLFEAGNLLIQAPTSSGKTFIGEMAAIQTALRRKKVVYLVPLKALAEEKFLDFREKYADYGLKVIISTRDHREFDADFEGGEFSIAVVVYEKLAQLLVRRPERIAEIDLIIADELELLSDPERGDTAEILLTRVLQAQRRLIGLSAVIGGAERLAEWMQAKLVSYDRRPVELRYGVLHEGTFRYRTHNEQGEGAEPFVQSGEDSAWEILTQNVCVFAERGEPCLIFVKAKHESRRGAELLAGRVHLGAAQEAIAALGKLEATRSRESLLHTLSNGVAFHNADLSPAERHIVEGAFRAGEVKVLVSTSTLAVGMNLPAQNVFIASEKWRYDQRLGIPWKTPILRMEYENMSGRAGRYGAGHAFGRSILIATSAFDQETLWRRYIEGERDAIEPRLNKAPLENHVLRLVASRFCRTLPELLAFLESTLTGKWVWAELYPIEEIEFRIRAAVNRCLDAGVVATAADGKLEATPFGAAVAAKGISIATARELEHWIAQCETRSWPDIDLLHAAASTPDGRMLQVMLTAREYEEAGYAGVLKRLSREDPLQADTPINRIRNSNVQPFFDEVRAIKITLFLHEWISQRPVCEIEESFNTMAGQVLSAAEQLAWLIDATAAIATALGTDGSFVERIRRLAERTQHGLYEQVLPLARIEGLELP
ncbi:MAG: DEAD/DEAH box helicase, partial [Candidatus Hydrogenedentes bacterium]|nr:DEAD/DEAH box helicase [Candidatus Hydrogenedentota bacterium]